jgi:predicted transcriptional regulator YdeE
MEHYTLEEDVRTLCVGAKSFPEGIMGAFITLEEILPDISGRTFYGISYQNKQGDIIYKAAVAELFDGEAEKHGCERFIISKGDYLTETIIDWRKKIEAIGDAFENLLAHPAMADGFPCVEWYKSEKEVMCMVKMDESALQSKSPGISNQKNKTSHG